MGDLVYEPPRDGPTLWEIGIPDRSAAEFYVPDPNPLYINKLYVNHPDRLASLASSLPVIFIFKQCFKNLRLDARPPSPPPHKSRLGARP